MKLLTLTLPIICAITATTLCATEPIRVLIWDEQQPQQKQAYGEKFLGETIAARLAMGGIEYLDAPVSGGEPGAIEGTLTIMVGGSAACSSLVCIPPPLRANVTRRLPLMVIFYWNRRGSEVEVARWVTFVIGDGAGDFGSGSSVRRN